ncbi:MAG: Aminopeptidase YpdF [Elusimicrobia bacterium]|nr:Aminopeptidase YpdF [Elusimicrobiota bacterium]
MKKPLSKFVYLNRRMSAFREILKDKKLDGFLLTHLSDLYYFTDYKTEGYYALIGLKEAWLFLPNLLFEQGKASTRGFHCLQGKFFEELKKVISKNRLKRIGFDPHQLPFSFGQSLEKMGFVSEAGLVTQLRAIKDVFELKRLRAANHLAALGAEFVRRRLKPGIREKQVAADLAHFFNIKGDGIAFDLIIAGGKNGAFPHHITSNDRLKNGEPVICDIGATWEGYRSDLTRTFPLGRMPAAFTKVFNIVNTSQKQGIRHLKPGVTAGSVDQVCRRVIEEAGYGKTFVHSTGHGVGIDIHEHPRIGPDAKDRLEEGMVVTVEPGIYLPGKFGVRIEDTLLITKTGSEILTK